MTTLAQFDVQYDNNNAQFVAQYFDPASVSLNYIRMNGVWVEGTPYVASGNQWKTFTPYKLNAGTWE